MTTKTDIDETLALYRTMTTKELQRLRSAFMRDARQMAPSDPGPGVDFVRRRIALIDAVLAKRA